MLNTDSNSSTDCKLDSLAGESREAVELLPWLLNGSLDFSEAVEVRNGLDADDPTGELASELAATGEMFWLTSQHVPTMDLVAYAFGLPTETLDREEIERHLSGCAACRAELEMILADQSAELEAQPATVLDFAAARKSRESAPTRQQPAWRRLALAAGLAAAVAGALLVQVAGHLDAPATPFETYAGLDSAEITQVQVAADTVAGIDGTSRGVPVEALFTDGFESGDTSNWSTQSTN